MKVYILYHPDSEHSRVVEEYVHDYEHTRGKSMELVSLEARNGADLAKLYDVLQYPAVLVIKDDDQLVKSWEGVPLPLMNEVSGYSEG